MDKYLKDGKDQMEKKSFNWTAAGNGRISQFSINLPTIENFEAIVGKKLSSRGGVLGSPNRGISRTCVDSTSRE